MINTYSIRGNGFGDSHSHMGVKIFNISNQEVATITAYGVSIDQYDVSVSGVAYVNLPAGFYRTEFFLGRMADYEIDTWMRDGVLVIQVIPN